MAHVSRDSRKVADFLGSLCLQHDMEYNMNAEEIYALESTMLIFFAPPVINLMKTRSKTVRKFSDKHGTMAYWMPVVFNMLRNSGSAKRQSSGVESGGVVQSISYQHIVSDYLLTDYSHEDLVGLMKITGTYSYDEIAYACGVGKSNRVYEVRYISAVLEKERAKKGVVIAQRNQIAQMADMSNSLLNEEIHHHSPLDMAQVEYNWTKMQANAELEAKVKSMLDSRRNMMCSIIDTWRIDDGKKV